MAEKSLQSTFQQLPAYLFMLSPSTTFPWNPSLSKRQRQKSACRTKALHQDRCCSSFSAMLPHNTKIFGTKHPIKDLPWLLADGASQPNLQPPANVGCNLIANTVHAFFPAEQPLHNFSFQFVNQHCCYEVNSPITALSNESLLLTPPFQLCETSCCTLAQQPGFLLLHHQHKTSLGLLMLWGARRGPWKNSA